MVLSCSLAPLVPACTSSAASKEATLTGTATYRERIALPPTATFEAMPEDVSRAEAPAEVLGRARIPSSGNPPIRFSIPCDADRVDRAHRYAVRARTVADETLLFTTDTNCPVLSAGHPGSVTVLLRRVGQVQGAQSQSRSTAMLENTYWKLTRLGTAAITVPEKQREPHFTLHPSDHRVSGSGGCNRLVGTYTLDGNQLAFLQNGRNDDGLHGRDGAGACIHEALRRVAMWRIAGEILEFSDASGTVVAQFESRYMK